MSRSDFTPGLAPRVELHAEVTIVLVGEDLKRVRDPLRALTDKAQAHGGIALMTGVGGERMGLLTSIRFDDEAADVMESALRSIRDKEHSEVVNAVEEVLKGTTDFDIRQNFLAQIRSAVRLAEQATIDRKRV